MADIITSLGLQRAPQRRRPLTQSLRQVGISSPQDSVILSAVVPKTNGLVGIASMAASTVRSLASALAAPLARLATNLVSLGAQRPAVRTEAARPVVAARDRRALATAGRNGLWITVEKAPQVVVGGLGQVSETVPQALNDHLGKDVRILVPYLRPMKKSAVPFEKTGVTTTLRGPDGKHEVFELLQQVEEGKPVVYAIANDRYFGNHDTLYFSTPKEDTGLGKDAIFKAVMMYNRAASELIPALDSEYPTAAAPPPTSKVARLFAKAAARLLPSLHQPRDGHTAPTNKVHAFRGGIDFIISNDWLTAPLFGQLDPAYAEKVGKIFYLHNVYNESRSTWSARENGMVAPLSLSRYSPLKIGVEKADAIIANEFYVQRLTQGLAGNADFVEPLKKQLEAGRVFDMHHGLSDLYRPRQNPLLQRNGYTDLDVAIGQPPTAASLQRLEQFKAQNRSALQHEYGLSQNPEAVIFSWVARPEPYQKGFYMVMDALGKFMSSNPRAQLIMAGINLEKSPAVVVNWIKSLQQDPALKGRVSFPGFVSNDRVVRIAAGSSFLMLPSLYEPYGLSQLEAMRVGTIPIAHAVDGLKATVVDSVGEAPPRLRPYGQTGIFMEPLDVPAYWRALDAVVHNSTPTAEQVAVLQAASAKFGQALNRAMALQTEQPAAALGVRWNAMRFVEEQHDWKEISQRYIGPIQTAVQAAANRRP